MIRFDQEWLAFMRDLFPPGTQIQCGKAESQTPALFEETGTIDSIDDLGLFHCSLADGRTLVAAPDERCFRVDLPEQPEPFQGEDHQELKKKNQNLPECGEDHSEQRMAVLGVVDSWKLPEWAADILFPPVRSILALPGEPAKIVNTSSLGRSIRSQINAGLMSWVVSCSDGESVNIYFDRDARRKGAPFNRRLGGFSFYGPILINGMHAEDRALTKVEAQSLLQSLNDPSACVERPAITEVNKDTFWTLIEQAKEHPGGPGEWLMEQLVSMGPEQAKNFDNITHAYMDAAYQYGLWTAASVMECGGCSDDGFMDFRAWLVGQGRETYMAALKDPDTLADAPPYQDSCFDALPYMGDSAYEELTGRDIYEDFDSAKYQTLAAEIKRDITYGEGINYPYRWSETAGYLPRLCEKYLTPEDRENLVRHHNDTWNLTSPEVKRARETASKGKKAKCRGGEAR